MKTNDVRRLEHLRIPFEPQSHEVDPDNLSAENVAARIGPPAGQVVKPRDVQGDGSGVSLARDQDAPVLVDEDNEL